MRGPFSSCCLVLVGNRFMWLILLEALGALLILLFIIWWTMFSGRKRGELDRGTEKNTDSDDQAPGRKD
jgi:cbb3-type cytochrome oxidase subunit 3